MCVVHAVAVSLVAVNLLVAAAGSSAWVRERGHPDRSPEVVEVVK